MSESSKPPSKPAVSQPQNLKDTNKLRNLQIFYSAFSAQAFAKTCDAPIDRVKKLLQIQHVYIRIPSDQRYKGMLDCMFRVYRDQGLLSFWRGNLTNIAQSAVGISINIIFKEYFKILTGGNMLRPNHRHFVRNMMAGGFGGVLSQIFLYPFSFVQTRLQADVGSSSSTREFFGFRDCVKKLYRIEGYQIFFTGLTVSLTGTFVYRSFYFGLHDFFWNFMFFANHKPNILTQFSIGSIVTFIAAFIAYPFDIIRHRVMIQQGRTEKLFSSGIECAMWTMKNEGLIGFYRGLFVHYLKSYNGAMLGLILNTKIQISINKKKE
ncbi:adp atp translocase [Stylonychia lemnae]|uniref:ADP/ATP translocase n=1 Tax=Stylonychia lemnae TaxID=5949 RepID=A0A078ANY7_STYLE|nr:adp atp translocase [Stylonychia lemnae]|eukprot:CDW82673.1 adp atp translocase [Stylonychia lemnae]